MSDDTQPPLPAASDPSAAVLITPYRSRRGSGHNALLVETTGWATAAAKRFGGALVVSPDGCFTPEEARRQVVAESAGASAPMLRRRPPEVFVTAAKDLRALRDARHFSRRLDTWATHNRPVFVWQQHSLFQRGGLRLARRVGAPFVLFVDAPIVWEAAQWGVHRPVWGWLLERRSEATMFKSADVVACVTSSVAERVIELGAEAGRTVVTPCSADPTHFHPGRNRTTTRARLGIAEDEVVVGWIGSFRRFHGLDKLVAAAAVALPGTAASMLLVGDGAERSAVQEGLARHGVRAVFTGTRPHTEVPDLLAAMDIAVVTAMDRDSFHYSPLKLSEYLASGLAVVVPDAGALSTTVKHDEHGLVVPTDSVDALASALARLIDDPGLRRRLGAAAVARASELLTWDKALDDVLVRLDQVGPRPSRGKRQDGVSGVS